MVQILEVVVPWLLPLGAGVPVALDQAAEHAEDLAEYGAGAAGAGPGEGNGAGEAKGGEAGLKVLQCRRRYSDFDRLHKNLRKLVGVKALPKYPAKALFNRFNDKVIQDRIAFFLALLKVIADSEALQRSEPVLEFVCKVSPRALLRLGLD